MESKTREELLVELRHKDEEIKLLKKQLEEKTYDSPKDILAITTEDVILGKVFPKTDLEFNNEDIARYSRQLILPEIGPQGQKKLLNSSVLIVGCGGLGCPAAIYLGAAGVGHIGLLDYDVVEINNLHRQVVHTEGRIGMSKAMSIAHSISALNSKIQVVPYNVLLTSEVALQLVSKFDIILDCTDNVATRYLLNDACVMADKPLVSGSALKFEGQLTVYHYNSGPCYRCLHPKPPPPETVTNCSDGGVLGVVPGTIGVLQALEAIKIITEIGTPLSQSLLLFDALQTTFRKVKLRSHKSDCEVCGDKPLITKLIDYEQFCGAAASDKDAGLTLLPSDERLTVEQYQNIIVTKTPHVLVDVRLPVELEICALPGCINIPLKEIESEKTLMCIKENLSNVGSKSVYCVCKRGNDSQLAVKKLAKILNDEDYVLKDIMGGMTAWAKKIDPTFPVY